MLIALTTSDNPFDYFDQFDEWYMYDLEKGYHTLNFLGRIARTSTEVSDAVYDAELERAIDEIVYYDVINLTFPDVHYIKVKREDTD